MIKFKLDEGVELPEYKSEQAEGIDVVAHKIMKCYKGDRESKSELENIKKGFERSGYIKIRAFERILFDTGLTVADMDENIELQVRVRSSIALKKGLMVLNSPGTIDSDYRGTIGVILFNPTPFMTQIDKGERIAQLVPTVKPVYTGMVYDSNYNVMRPVYIKSSAFPRKAIR